MMWKGKKIEEMTKEELIKTIEEMGMYIGGLMKNRSNTIL